MCAELPDYADDNETHLIKGLFANRDGRRRIVLRVGH